MTRWRKLLRLSGEDRRLVLEAALRLLMVDVALRLFGFPRVRRRLAAEPSSTGAAGGPDVPAYRVERIAWSVAAAGRHHLYPIRCLARSFVLQAMLARRGVPSTLRIGVRKEDGRFEAHAWVEHEGRPLAEREDVERRFSTLAVGAP